jgi:hypothetical protein
MLEADYGCALRAANQAESNYLGAVRRGEERATLADLSAGARDLWSEVAAVCALGEGAARSEIAFPRLRQRRDAVDAAWVTRRNWAACGEEAAGHSDLAGALTIAHQGRAASPRASLRLVASTA